MSLSILNRGASGGLKPELVVTAPSGSTIDIIQNGIIVSTYTLGANEMKHTFTVKVGTYAVKGTLGADTSQTNVVVDAIGQYTVSIEYTYWLYNLGDEREHITGGWASPPVRTDFYGWDCFYDSRYATRSAKKNNDNLQADMSITTTSSSYYGVAAASYWAANPIDLTGISTIKYDVDVTNVACLLMATNSSPFTTNVGVNEVGPKRVGHTVVGRSIASVDVSDLTGKYYVGFGVAHYTNSKQVRGCKVYKIWLE